MDVETHWETIYKTKPADAVSWYRPHLEVSLGLIERAAANSAAAIIDVGGGESTLVDDLVSRGFYNVTVLDISATALDATQQRLGQSAEQVRWISADVTQVSLPRHSFDVWHDRAVFHFLTAASARVRLQRKLLRIGGVQVDSIEDPYLRVIAENSALLADAKMCNKRRRPHEKG
jgi:ubiquinone/menaquinone biosynthesis C-methylase UbiE